MTQDAHGGHGHGHGHDKPEIVKQLEEADELIKTISGNYLHVHSHAHTKAIEKLAEEGILERDAQGFIKFDKLEEKDAQDKLHQYMMEHFDTFMKGHLKEMWSGLSKQWKDFYRRTVLGTTEDSLKHAISTYGKDYSVDAHRQIHKEALDHILQQHDEIKKGLVKGEHAKDVAEHYLKIPKEHLDSIDWDILGNDYQIQQLMQTHSRLEGRPFSERYFKGQVWYKKDAHDAHGHAGHGHGGH